MKLNHLLLFLVAVLTFGGCSQKEEPQAPTPQMSLLAQLDGKPWQATSFLVEQNPAMQTSDAHLLIQASRAVDGTNLYLYLYEADKPGTYTVSNQGNPRRQNCGLEKFNANGTFSFFGEGPATITLTHAADGHFSGTFTGSFVDPATKATVEVTGGRFDVFTGICNEEGMCIRQP